MAVHTPLHSHSTTQSVADDLLEEHELDDKVHEFVTLTPETEVNPPPLLAWVILLLCLGFGLILFSSIFKSFISTPLTLTTPIVESSRPTPTSPLSLSPSPTLPKVRPDIKVRILNGSGTPGLAGIAKSYLESLGYKNIETGNADSFQYPSTSISVRPGFPEIATLMTEDLQIKYKLTNTIGTLPATGLFDVEVVVGTE